MPLKGQMIPGKKWHASSLCNWCRCWFSILLKKFCWIWPSYKFKLRRFGLVLKNKTLFSYAVALHKSWEKQSLVSPSFPLHHHFLLVFSRLTIIVALNQPPTIWYLPGMLALNSQHFSMLAEKFAPWKTTHLKGPKLGKPPSIFPLFPISPKSEFSKQGLAFL